MASEGIARLVPQASRAQTGTCIACRRAPAAPASLNCAGCYKRAAGMGVSGASAAYRAIALAFPGPCGCPYALSRGHLHSCKGIPGEQ